MYFVLVALTWRPVPVGACSRLCSRVSTWVGVFADAYVIGVVRVCNCLCRDLVKMIGFNLLVRFYSASTFVGH